MLKRWNTGQDIQNFLKGVSPKSVPPFFLTLLLSWFFPLSPSLAVPISLLPTSAPLASSVISITLTRSSHLYSPDSKDLGQLTAGSVVQIRLPDEIIASLHGRTRMSNAELLSYMTNASRTAVKVISAHSHSTTRSNVALGSLNLRQLLSSDGVRLSEIKPYQPSAPARRSSTPAASVAHESDPNLARPALQARAACFKCQKPSAHGPTELHESTQRLGQAIAPRPVQNRETPPPPQASANLANITPQTLARYGQSPKVRALMADSK